MKTEDYIPDPDTASNLVFMRPDVEFMGRKLAPLSTAARMLWINLTEGSDHPRFMGLLLIYMLGELQSFYDESVKHGVSEEGAWRNAKSVLLARTDRRHEFRLGFLEWMEKLKKRDITKAVTLASKLLDEADAEDTDDEPNEDLAKQPLVVGGIELTPGK